MVGGRTLVLWQQVKVLTWFAWHEWVSAAYGEDDPEPSLPNLMSILSLDGPMDRRRSLLQEPPIAAMVAVWNTHFRNGDRGRDRKGHRWGDRTFLDEDHCNVA